MATGQFEVSGAPSSALGGAIEAEIYEYGGVAPTTIIRIDQDWSVKLKWKLSGALLPLVCGEWCLHVNLESIGNGPEFSLPDPGVEVNVPLQPGGTGEYDYDFKVSKGKISAEHCSVPYKVVTTVTYRNVAGRPGPMAGFVEGPIIQFYDPGP